MHENIEETALSSRLSQPRRRRWTSKQQDASFYHLVAIVEQIRRQREWYDTRLEGASLAHKVVRTLLWDLVANDTLLFQAAIFVAGTYSNVIPMYVKCVSFGPALLVLRGESLRGLMETSKRYHERGGYKTAAVAMLAGWERRFGDYDSYETHMRQWRSMALDERAFDESYVLTLLDVAFQTFQDSLDLELHISSSLDVAPRDHVPPALERAFGYRAESRALRALVSRLAAFDPEAPASVPEIRKLCIEFLIWGPTSCHGYIPNASVEATIENVELLVLYQVRAACMSLSAMLLDRASTFHQVAWDANVRSALAAHTFTCRRLPTDELVDTEFRAIALWTRSLICTADRDPTQDDLLRRLIANCGIKSWDDLHALLHSHIYHEEMLAEATRDLYMHVMQP